MLQSLLIGSFIQEKIFYLAMNPCDRDHDGIERPDSDGLFGEIKKVIFKKHDQPGMRFSSGADKTMEYFHASTSMNVNRIMNGFF